MPMIVPSPPSRPHSYNLTMQLFLDASLQPNIAQQAEEKQTIVNMVGADIGAAIVPYWTSRNAVNGVVYLPLVNESGESIRDLPLSAAWVKGSHDPFREQLMGLLQGRLEQYSH